MEKLRLLPKESYIYKTETDPLRYYYWPVFGSLYTRRVELCLEQCTGGEKLLEVGFGSGITFPNLSHKYEQIHGLDLFADAAAVQSMWHTQGIEPHLVVGDVTSMDFATATFDTVLLISILEHLHPEQLRPAFAEIKRVLKPGGQMVVGVPVERPLMVHLFSFLGYNIREHHFSTEHQIIQAARDYFDEKLLFAYRPYPFLGSLYNVGHFVHQG